MKNAIKEYLDMSESEKDSLIKTATIVFDTNVLLNLYRCSKSTRDALLEIMNSFKDRLWIPNQVAKEFMSNRPEVIIQTKKIYEDMKSSGMKLVEEFAKDLRIKSNEESCEELKNVISKWVEDKRQANLLVSSCSDDKILEQILSLFDERVGNEYDSTTLDKIKKEGKDRYEKQIPPGYRDNKKINGNNDNNAFGDLIYWKQILDYAEKNKDNVILVTSDQKEDWWSIIKGQTIGPRPELKKEFHDITGKNFHMYNMEQFINRASEHPNAEVIEEIKSISSGIRFPEARSIKYEYKPKKLFKINKELERLENQINDLENQINYLEKKNIKRYDSLRGFKRLMTSGLITYEQMNQYRQIQENIARDQHKIAMINEQLLRLRTTGIA